jgi:putative endonuclease
MNLGEKGESLAEAYLTKKGYQILERNFRNRYGEIDLIARDKDEIVFVEVKARNSCCHGLPCEAVNLRKQRKIQGVAEYYLLVTGNTHRSCRMDVVEVLFIEEQFYIRQILNAF